MTPVRIALVGLGKIARDQHLPTIAADERFQLTAIVTLPQAAPERSTVPCFPSLDALLDAKLDFDAVALCTPPRPRHGLASAALAAGKHVMLEKPPGATVAEVEDLKGLATSQGVSLFSAWHSQHAAGVAPAKAWLADRQVQRAGIIWKEDVRVWHPGQDWIFEAGGLGVFDPAINALSIATHILPRSFFLTDGVLEVPSNRQAPIRAQLAFRDTAGAPIAAELDFLQSGLQTWDIEVETDRGALRLSNGGAKLWIDGTLVHEAPDREYPALYDRFARLIAQRVGEVDITPLIHVSDAFLMSRRVPGPAFDW